MNVFVRALFNMGSERDTNREVVERVGEVMGSGGKVGSGGEGVGSGGDWWEPVGSTKHILDRHRIRNVACAASNHVGRYTCRTLQIHTCVRAFAHAVMFGHVLVPM